MEALVPSLCPCCGYQTIIHTTQKRIYGELKLTKTLFCHNPNCASQNLRKFVHFVGKKAMDIEGLSEVTLEQFIARGWLQDLRIFTGWIITGKRSSVWTVSEKDPGSGCGMRSKRAATPHLNAILSQWIFR